MRRNHLVIVGALITAEVGAVFESTMIYVALPTLIRAFGDPVTAGWLVTSHGLIGTSAALMAGRLGDIHGRKRIALIMLTVAIFGSILSALTSHYAIVLLGRSLQGMAAAIIPLSIGILREALDKERVPVAVGLMSTGLGIGAAMGLVLGGLVIDYLNWHALFAVSAALLSLSWLAIWAFVPGRPGSPPKAPIDWIEGILPVPGITAILLGISMSTSRGWLNPVVLALVATGIAILAYWARRSLRAREPFIDLRLLANRNVALGNAMAFILALGTMQMILVFSAYMQNPVWTLAGLGMSATVAGLAKFPSNFLSFFAGPFAGWLMQKRGMRLPAIAGGLIAGAGWFLALGMPNDLIEIILLLCVVSFGTTMLSAAIPNIIVASVPEERTSEAIGAMSVVRGMGQSIGSQIIAVMLAAQALRAPDGSALPSGFGFQLTMAWVMGLTLLSVIAALVLRDERTRGSLATKASA